MRNNGEIQTNRNTISVTRLGRLGQAVCAVGCASVVTMYIDWMPDFVPTPRVIAEGVIGGALGTIGAVGWGLGRHSNVIPVNEFSPELVEPAEEAA
jgi:hypothetical protein